MHSMWIIWRIKLEHLIRITAGSGLSALSLNDLINNRISQLDLFLNSNS